MWTLRGDAAVLDDYVLMMTTSDGTNHPGCCVTDNEITDSDEVR